MKKRATSGFTLIELMVVMMIIAVIGALLLPAVFSALEKQKIVATEMTLKDLGNALEAYKIATKSYPLDYEDGSLSQGPVTGFYSSDRGYFWVLQNYTTYTFNSGKRTAHTRPFFPESTDYVWPSSEGVPNKNATAGPGGYNDNFIKDIWGNPIQYRRLPTTYLDFKRRFYKNGTKEDFEKFKELTGGKPFHIWSWGPDGEVEDSQLYTDASNLSGIAPDGSSVSGNTDYQIGGYWEDNDDIGNWR